MEKYSEDTNWTIFRKSMMMHQNVGLYQTSAHYYHIDIDCLKRRRPNCKLTIADLRFMEGVSMSNEIKCKLLIDS